MAEERVPVIMDVDTGVDDCIALLYAVASPNVELVAATCCAGPSPNPAARGRCSAG
jgi:pyrimidine-specific ribonucleoside hydrolase